jgi:hypothetical protein
MAIKKQDFYEGSALYQLIKNSSGVNVRYADPFFVFNDQLHIHLKYSTGKRSPWSFTFAPDEQIVLRDRALGFPLAIGLVCGADGVAALQYREFAAATRIGPALRIACYRLHREHFEIRGPHGTVPGKIAPSDWIRLLRKVE